MNQVLVNIGVVLLFILVGGFFAAAEIALVSLRESQLDRLAATGKRGRRLRALAGNPNRFLAAVQVGVTLAGFVSAGFGAAQIAPALEPWLTGLGLSTGAAGTIAFIAVTVVIAYFSLVLGELAPKRLALQRAETVAMALAAPVDWLARLSRPFIWLLSRSTDGVVRLLGGDPGASKEVITGEELRGMVAAHQELSPEERELIDDVFAVGDRMLREVMIPRTEVDFLDAALPVRAAARAVADMPHSRYPVIDGSADDVVGFVHLRDILTPGVAGEGLLGDLAREVLLLPGSKQVLPALTEMRRDGHHLAVVVDEYGGTAGIVTLEDLVEELIGDIRDEYDDTDDAPVHGATGELDIDGLTNIEDFAEETGVALPEGPYETAAGFVVAALGRLPELGATVDVGSRRLTVIAMDGRRIARLRVSPSDHVASREHPVDQTSHAQHAAAGTQDDGTDDGRHGGADDRRDDGRHDGTDDGRHGGADDRRDDAAADDGRDDGAAADPAAPQRSDAVPEAVVDGAREAGSRRHDDVREPLHRVRE